MKHVWMDTMAHLHAQEVTVFVIFLLATVFYAGWREWRHG